MESVKKLIPNEIAITIDEKTAEGIYTRGAMVASSFTEFTFDFFSDLPGGVPGKVKARLILNPVHAKRFLSALQENIGIYEGKHGKIIDKGPFVLPKLLGPTGDA